MFSIDRLRQLTEEQKITARKIDPDSAAYALVGKKCFFCGTFITRSDITPPNECFESSQDHITHGNCLNYVLKKFPDVPMLQLENKIVRMRVEGTGIGGPRE